MRILIASTQMSPIAGEGGSADFVRALASGLGKLGFDARVALPCSGPMCDDARHGLRPAVEGISVQRNGLDGPRASVWTGLVDGIYVYLVGTDGPAAGRPDAFAAALPVALRHVQPAWAPDVIHINDSCPGLVALYLNVLCEGGWGLRPVPVVTTVHGHESDAGRATTFVMGGSLEHDMRVLRRYRSPMRLARMYEPIYRDAVAGLEPEALAA